MRLGDPKRALSWLGGGLICGTGVLVGILYLHPSRSHARNFGEWAHGQLNAARRARCEEPGKRPNSPRAYAAAFEVKIDGIRPSSKMAEVRPTPPAGPRARLSDLIVVVAVWTNVAFFRRKAEPTTLDAVEVGNAIPKERIPALGAEAKLLRIEYGTSPFRVVFEARGEVVTFRVAPHEGLSPGASDASAEAVPERMGGDRFCSSLGEFLQLIFTEPERGSRLATFTPKGVRIMRGPTTGPIRRGDLITRINDVPIRDRLQILSHFKRHPLKAGSCIRVEAVRCGRVIIQTLRI